MKWAALSIALMVGVPLMTAAMHFIPRSARWAIALFLFLAMNDLGGILSINLISYEWYRGSSRGIEVTALDLIALSMAFYVLLLKPWRMRSKWPTPEGIFFLLYGLIGLFSIVMAYVPLYAAFGAWKVIRGLLIFWVFSQIVDKKAHVQIIITIFALLPFYQALAVFHQKYVLHMYRCTGTLPHMNTLAMLTNLTILPVFAIFLLEEVKPKGWHLASVGAAVFNVLSTLSRGALVSLVAGMGLCAGFLRLKHLNRRRLIFIGIMALGVMAGGIKASDTLIDRFINAPIRSGETREEFNVCAQKMAADMFWGAGLNNFSHMIGKTKYARWAPPALDGGPGTDDGVAHHIYWLTAAELGYPGLVIYLCLIVAVQFRCILIYFQSRDSFLRAFAVGCFIGLFSLHLQGLLEWIMRQTNTWFYFCAIAGTLNAIGKMRIDDTQEESDFAASGEFSERLA